MTLMVPYKMLDENAAVADAFHQRGQSFMGQIIGVGATLGLAGNNQFSSSYNRGVARHFKLWGCGLKSQC